MQGNAIFQAVHRLSQENGSWTLGDITNIRMRQHWERLSTHPQLNKKSYVVQYGNARISTTEVDDHTSEQRPPTAPTVSIVDEDCIFATQTLARRHPDKKVVALHIADPQRIGGHSLKRCGGHEYRWMESTDLLVAQLAAELPVTSSHLIHRTEEGFPAYQSCDLSKTALYFPNITVLQPQDNEDAIEIDVVSVGAIRKKEVEESAIRLGPDAAKKAYITRIKALTRQALSLAKTNNATVISWAAFGCAGYRDWYWGYPELAAKVIRDVLDEPLFQGAFTEIVFPIKVFCQGDTAIVHAFEKTFFPEAIVTSEAAIVPPKRQQYRCHHYQKAQFFWLFLSLFMGFLCIGCTLIFCYTLGLRAFTLPALSLMGMGIGILGILACCCLFGPQLKKNNRYSWIAKSVLSTQILLFFSGWGGTLVAVIAYYTGFPVALTSYIHPTGLLVLSAITSIYMGYVCVSYLICRRHTIEIIPDICPDTQPPMRSETVLRSCIFDPIGCLLHIAATDMPVHASLDTLPT